MLGHKLIFGLDILESWYAPVRVIVFEQFVRENLPGAQRYWNAKTEVDIVLDSGEALIIGEVKWASLSKPQAAKLLSRLRQKIANDASFVTKSKRPIWLDVYDRSFLRTGKAVLKEQYHP